MLKPSAVCYAVVSAGTAFCYRVFIAAVCTYATFFTKFNACTVCTKLTLLAGKLFCTFCTMATFAAAITPFFYMVFTNRTVQIFGNAAFYA